MKAIGVDIHVHIAANLCMHSRFESFLQLDAIFLMCLSLALLGIVTQAAFHTHNLNIILDLQRLLFRLQTIYFMAV